MLGFVLASIPFFFSLLISFGFLLLSCWPYAGLSFAQVSNGLCVLHPQLAESSSSLS